jgi:hypothetical protein
MVWPLREIELNLRSHQGPTLEDMPTVSEAEYDASVTDNVHKWVGAHIIPVSLFSQIRSLTTDLSQVFRALSRRCREIQHTAGRPCY